MNVLAVMLDSDSTAAQRNAFTAWLREDHKGIGFWHNIEHAWIIAVPDHKQLDTGTIRDKLKELAPAVNSMVVHVQRGHWSGLAPASSHKWLEDYLRL